MQIKYLALLTILPLFAGILIGSNVSLSNAVMYDGVVDDETPKPNLVTGNIVCGDRLCGELDDEFKIKPQFKITDKKMEEFAPRFELISINRDKPDSDSNRYTVTFKAYSGSLNLEDITLRGYSDVEEITVNIGSLVANSESINIVKIKAMDPSSITGELLTFRLNPPEF